MREYRIHTICVAAAFALFLFLCASPVRAHTGFVRPAAPDMTSIFVATPLLSEQMLVQHVDRDADIWQTTRKRTKLETTARNELPDRFTSGRRARELTGNPCARNMRNMLNSATSPERRFYRDADRAKRASHRHILKAYQEKSARDITEGGKNVIRELQNISDWREAIRPLSPR